MRPGEHVGEFDAAPLFQQWDQIETLATEMERVDQLTGPALTARKIDEAQPAGHRGYMLANGHIGNGLEHIATLRHLFVEYGATPRVPWTLLRSVYEAGFWSTWLLEPRDGPTRRLRGLRAEVGGMRERRAFYREFFRFDPAERDRRDADHIETEKSYRADAEAMGVEWSQVGQRITVVDELRALEAVNAGMEPDVRAVTVATWRSLSGMQHGHAYALVLNSDVHTREAMPGGERRMVAVNDNALRAAAMAGNMLLAAGLRLYIERCTRPA